MADYELPGFSKGINNVAREDQLDRRQLRSGLNIDLLPGGRPVRRAGYKRVVEGGKFHSFFSTSKYCLYVQDGALHISEDLSTSFILIPSGMSSLVVYELINEEVYFSDGVRTGVVSSNGDLRPLGTPSPVQQPVLSVLEEDGGLYEGLYQVAITYLTTHGYESGTLNVAPRISIPEGGGIRLSSIPQPVDPNVAFIRVYASDPNGEELYFREALPVGTTTHDLGFKRPKKKLATHFRDVLPAGDTLTYFNGRLYTSQGRFLYFSDPLNYGLYDTTEGYLIFSSRIPGTIAVDAGIFVSDKEGTHFLRGQRPDEFKLDQVDSHAMIRGTATNVDGVFFNEELAGSVVAVWWSEEGVMVIGLPDGNIRKIREGELALPEFESGVISEVTRRNVKQLVSVLKNPGQANSLAAADSVDIAVHRNGIEI